MYTGYVSRCGSDSDTSSDLDMDALITKASHDDRPRPRIRSSSDPDGRKRKDRNRKRNKDSKEKGDKAWEEKKKQKEEKDADTEKEKSPLSKNRESQNEETQNKEETAKLQEGQQTKIEIREHYSGELRENVGQESRCDEDVHAAEEHPSVSEASDSLNTDSRVITSVSSDSLDALEEDDLVSCSSSFTVLPNAPSQTLNSHSPLQLHHYSHNQVHPHLLAPPPAHSHPLIHLTADDRRQGGGLRRSDDGADPQHLSSVPPSSSLQCIQKCPSNPCSDDSSLCFAELSRLVDFLPSPPEASDDDEEAEEELRRRKRRKGKMLKETGECVSCESGSISVEGSLSEHPLTPSPSSSNLEFVFNFDQSDARCYYKLCSNITPDSARSLPCPPDRNEGADWVKVKADPAEAVYLEPIPILQPPPGFGDSSSDEEFFDARDRFTSPVDPALDAMPRGDLLFIIGLPRLWRVLETQAVNAAFTAIWWLKYY